MTNKIKMTETQINICEKFTNKYLAFYANGTDYSNNKQEGLDGIFNDAHHDNGFILGADNGPTGVPYSPEGVEQRKPYIIASYLVDLFASGAYESDEITRSQAQFDYEILLELHKNILNK